MNPTRALRSSSMRQSIRSIAPESSGQRRRRPPRLLAAVGLGVFGFGLGTGPEVSGHHTSSSAGGYGHLSGQAAATLAARRVPEPRMRPRRQGSLVPHSMQAGAAVSAAAGCTGAAYVPGARELLTDNQAPHQTHPHEPYCMSFTPSHTCPTGRHCCIPVAAAGALGAGGCSGERRVTAGGGRRCLQGGGLLGGGKDASRSIGDANVTFPVGHCITNTCRNAFHAARAQHWPPPTILPPQIVHFPPSSSHLCTPQVRPHASRALLDSQGAPWRLRWSASEDASWGSEPAAFSAAGQRSDSAGQRLRVRLYRRHRRSRLSGWFAAGRSRRLMQAHHHPHLAASHSTHCPQACDDVAGDHSCGNGLDRGGG